MIQKKSTFGISCHWTRKFEIKVWDSKEKKKEYRPKEFINAPTENERGNWAVFLKRYDFAYPDRDTVNQAAKVAPGVIKAVRNDINNIAKERINQIISQDGKEVERILPKLLKKIIEDVYQMSFRLLSNFWKQQFNKIQKRKILR